MTNTANYTAANQLVFNMLTENTGSHILDSGGLYGRNHERNASKTIGDFINEPEQMYELYTGEYRNGNKFMELTRTVSVYHFLSKLELDDICEEFNRLQDNSNNWDFEDAYGVSSEAGGYLHSKDADIQRTWNTYNGDSDLSQVLQGANVEIDGESYIILQVHGGCDVRGGYTDAKLFKLEEYSGLIHEYLMEFMDSYEIAEELEYIDSVIIDGKEVEFTQAMKQEYIELNED